MKFKTEARGGLKASIIKKNDRGEITDVLYSDNDLVQIDSYESVLESVQLNKTLDMFSFELENKEELIFILDKETLHHDMVDRLSESTHEIKNILAIIASTTMVLKRYLEKDKIVDQKDKCKEMLIDVEVCIQNIIMLLGGLKRSTLSAEKEYCVRFTAFLRNIESEVKTLSENSNIPIELHVDTKEHENRYIFTTGIMLDQVVINLIKNSIYELNRLEKTDSKIDIHISTLEDIFSFSITDNGKGIDSELHDKIFDKGFSTKGSDGNGIGLYLCKKNIEDHGGIFELDRKYQGGARFYFEIPYRK